MLISGTHLGIADQGQQSHNYQTPREHERIFFRCMTKMHLLSCLLIENLFLSTSDKFKYPHHSSTQERMKGQK